MGSVKCWGYGANGRLGNNGTANKDAPVDVVTSSSDTDPLTGIVQVSVGVDHSCALTSEGNVKCWGKGDNGQLGNDAASDSSTPVNVVAADSSTSLLSDIVQISVGGEYTCALTSGGGIKCWGSGPQGQLGNGTSGESNSVDAPVSVTTVGTTALTGIVGISMGTSHSCALKSGGGVVCWGEGNHGKLGDGRNNTFADRTRPVDVLTSADGNPALANIAQIGLGNAHSCAVTTTGAVKCWGNGEEGQLGNDATINFGLPMDVVDADGGSGTLNIGTTVKRYICYDDGSCALETE